MATGFQPDDEKKKRAALQQIPTSGMPAPAADGKGDNTELSRNVNNGLNALGGMGVVSSVPMGFKTASNAPQLGNTVREAITAGPGLVASPMASVPARVAANTLPTLPGVNVALQEGAQANALAGATRTLGNVSAGLSAADDVQAVPVASAPRGFGGAASGTWSPQPPQAGVTGTWPLPAVTPAATEAQAPPSEYARQMGAVGGFFADSMKTLVSAPGYGFNKPDAAVTLPAGASTAGAVLGTVNPTAADSRAAQASQPAAAPAAPANPNQITATRQPNGTMSFSGGPNIGKDGGDISYTGPAGFKPSGAGVTVVPGASFANGSPAGDAALSAARFAAADRGDFEAVRNSYFAQGQGFAGETKDSVASDQLREIALSPQGTPGRKAALQMLSDQTTATTTRQAQQATNDLAKQRLGMEQTAAGFTSRAAARVESLQTAYESAKPEDRPALEQQIRVLLGKDKAANWKTNVLQNVKNADGSTTEGSIISTNEQTGEFKRLDQGTPNSATTPTTQSAYDKLPKGAKYTKADGTSHIKG